MLLSIIWQVMEMTCFLTIAQVLCIGVIKIQVVVVLFGRKDLLIKTGISPDRDLECKHLLCPMALMIFIVHEL